MDTFIVIILGILALSRCGDSWSLDNLRLRHDRRRSPDSGAEAKLTIREAMGVYTWPIRMVWVLLACVFFLAGVAKLRYSGLQWVVSDNMATLLVLHAYVIANADPLTYWGPHLAAHPGAPQLIAATTVIIEVMYPLALVSRVARWILVPSAALMVLGIRVLMGPSFETLAVCALFWVPWSETLAKVAAVVQPRLPAVAGRYVMRHRRPRA